MNEVMEPSYTPRGSGRCVLQANTARTPEIQNALSGLEEELGRAAHVLEELERRLDPILGKGLATPPALGDPVREEGYTAAVATAILDKTNTLRAIAGGLRRLLNRLEV